MTTTKIEDIKNRLACISQGTWTAANMVHHERMDTPTPDEIGEYVAGCVRAGNPSQFLFVSVEKPDGPADVCHVGNGPTSPANADFIAHAPDDVRFLLAELDAAQKREQAQQAAWDRDWQAAVTAHDKCVAELDAARADRDKFRAGFESSQEQVTILLAARDHLVEQCAQLRSMLHIRTQELDAARARERLKHEALKAVVDGNDIAAERNHSIESWPGSPIRRQACAALAEGAQK